MTFDPTSLEPARLQDHQRFLARLAHALVRDRHAAEDLVQDAWVAALEQKAQPAGRGFLARVLRNRLSNRWKLADRRRAREAEVARPEAVDCTTPLEELEVERTVLDAVRALPEPVRGAIWMRYWRDLGPADIARATDVSVDTVKSRLVRGRTLLRERLERDLSTDERDWCAVLLAALPSETGTALPPHAAGTGASTPLLGAIWMGTTGKLCLASAAIAAGAFFLFRGGARPAVVPTTTSPGEVRAAQPEAAVERPVASETARVDVATPVAAVAPEPELSAAAAGARFLGRVLDDEVHPVAGLEVRLMPHLGAGGRGASAQTTLSDAEGRFSFAAERGGELSVVDPDWVTIGPASTGTRESVVLVARRRALGGLVVDDGGRPVEGAEITAQLPDGFRSRFPLVLDHTRPSRALARSGTDGRFALHGAARIRGAQLVVTHAGYRMKRIPLEALPDEATLVLLRLDDPGERVEGQVADAQGRPVAGASVSFGGEHATTDELGRFTLARVPSEGGYEHITAALGGESRTLTALKAGHLPGHLEVELDAAGRALWPDGLVLVLGGEPGSLAGRVVDETGAPVDGAMVWLDDVELFSMEGGGRSTEGLLGGSTARYVEVRTDARGAFVIPGLLPREYVVTALDPATGVITQSPPVLPESAGPLELVLDGEAVHPVVGGVLRSLDGTPQAGATLLLMTDASDMRFDGAFVRTSNLMLHRATTDAEGRFELEDVPRAHVYLEVLDDDLELTIYAIEELDEDEADDLELVCARRVHVQLTLDTEVAADELAIHDADDRPLTLRVYRGKPGPPRTRAPLHGTTSDTLSVAETGRVLVLYRDGVEVERRTVRLVSGELNEL